MRRRDHPPSDAERFAAAINCIPALYFKERRDDRGAQKNLVLQLLRELSEWVSGGQEEGGQRRWSRESLRDSLEDKNHELVTKDNLRKTLERIAERIATLNQSSEEGEYGIYIPEHRVYVQILGPTYRQRDDAVDDIWFDATFTTVEDLRGVPALGAGMQRELRNTVLPPQAPHFVGRERVLRRIVASLQNANRAVIGIAGGPAVGKTALALALAHEVRVWPQFRGYHIVAELESSYGGRSDATAIVSKLLGEPNLAALATEQARRSAFYSALHLRHGILILDDVDSGVALAELPPPNGWLFIITARIRLPIVGARWLDLQPLTHIAARELFYSTIGRKFDRDETAEDDPLDAISDELDRAPGAILAAAEYFGSHPHIDLESYLDKVFNVESRWEALNSNDRSVGSLSASFDRTYQCMSASDAAVYRQAAIFADSFSLDALIATVGDRATAAVTTLIRRGLVQIAKDEYRMGRLAQAHAFSVFTPAERFGAEEARARYYVTLAKTMQSSSRDAHDSHRALERHPADIVQCLEFLASNVDVSSVFADGYADLALALISDRFHLQRREGWLWEQVKDLLIWRGSSISAVVTPIPLAVSLLFEGARRCSRDRLLLANSLLSNDDEFQYHVAVEMERIERQRLWKRPFLEAVAVARLGQVAARSGHAVSISDLLIAVETFATLGFPNRARRLLVATVREIRMKGKWRYYGAELRFLHALIAIVRERWDEGLRVLRATTRGRRVGFARVPPREKIYALAAVAHAALGNAAKASELLLQLEASQSKGLSDRTVAVAMACANLLVGRCHAAREQTRVLINLSASSMREAAAHEVAVAIYTRSTQELGLAKDHVSQNSTRRSKRFERFAAPATRERDVKSFM